MPISMPESRLDTLDFQKRVGDWMNVCFSEDIIKNMDERVCRFIEESVELAQAMNLQKELKRIWDIIPTLRAKQADKVGREITGDYDESVI